MRVVIFLTAAAMLSCSFLQADAQTIPTTERVATSGKPQKIMFLPNLNPDCTLAGQLSFSTLGGPSHGQVTIETKKDNPNFPPANPRFKCNSRKIAAPAVFYQSDPSYVGEDEVVIEIVNENGIPQRLRVHLVVR